MSNTNAVPGPSAPPPHIRIVMATRNGAAFLPQQLESIVGQEHGAWSLFVGDDGSQDATCDIIRAFGDAHPQRDVQLVAGPGRGSAANFLTQAAAAVRPGDWLAFADQDDVWMPHKLARALDQIGPVAAGEVVAYSSRAHLADADLTPQGISPLHPRPPGFGNALVQNVISGYATVLSPAAADLVVRSVPHALAAGVPFHDWWIYQVITGAGGRVVLDAEPGLYYRQHGGNILGHHGGTRARLVRMKLLLNRAYAGWIGSNLEALLRCEALLTPQAHALVRGLVQMRAAPRARDRLAALEALEVYRQSAGGDRVLRVLARLGRL